MKSCMMLGLRGWRRVFVGLQGVGNMRLFWTVGETKEIKGRRGVAAAVVAVDLWGLELRWSLF